jgi:hypothetical protein
MAQWHLDELRSALERKGWRITELPGDDYRVSATWALERPAQAGSVFIDFDGLDDLAVLPLAKSYGCEMRDTPHGLYFARRGEKNSPARERWDERLDEFVRLVSRQ